MTDRTLTTTDPRTGVTRPTDIPATDDAAVTGIAAAARASGLERMSRSARIAMLETVATALEDALDDLVAVAATETGLTEARLAGEVRRSAAQFRLFADVVRDGHYLEAAIDHAGDTPLGAAPDVRRMLVPLGPVAVFGSSNFPFAFSVVGGDTASALAAGCPVVVKAHSSHPLTARRSFEVLRVALHDAGAPTGALGIVYGTQAGSRLVAEEAVRAVGFTGSAAAADALLAVIATRSTPIPFYGELSSVNPLIVTAAAAATRGPAIAAGLYDSVTGSAGQLCTKPGVAFVPAGAAGDRLVEEIARRARDAGAQPLLNDRIRESFDHIRSRLVDDGGARVLVAGAGAEGFAVTPTVLEIDAADLTEAATEEAFGPLVVIVRYADESALPSAVLAVPPSLTASLHSEPADHAHLGDLLGVLAERSGRLVFDGFPTGVRVGWAQHHGGPWPATNAVHTSVGASAIRRFLRPLAWQNAPAEVLPPELRDGDVVVPRRVDGVLLGAGG